MLDGQNVAQLSMLGPFPGLGNQDLDDDTGEDDSPLPSDWQVVEHLQVEGGNVDEREDDYEARDTGPEEELVVV